MKAVSFLFSLSDLIWYACGPFYPDFSLLEMTGNVGSTSLAKFEGSRQEIPMKCGRYLLESTTSTKDSFARSRTRSALSILLSFVLVFSVVPLSSATGNINKGDLAGTWAMTIIGQGGCGFETMYVTFTLNGNGSATNAVVKAHSVGCGDTTNTNQTFTVQTLNPNGSGFA